MTTPGLIAKERFTSEHLQVFSEVVECRHGKHWHVILQQRHSPYRRRVIAHSDNYREHWRQIYEASEHFILGEHP